MEPETKACEECGAANEELFELPDGRLVCEDCMHDLDYERCPDCGEIVSSSDTHEVNPGYFDATYVCEDCLSDYTQCENCGDYFSSAHMCTDDSDNIQLCYSCRDSYTRCEHCDALVPNDEIREWDDEYLCESCYAEISTATPEATLHNHSFKPTPIFHTRQGTQDDPPAELTFGVELEVDKGNSRNRCVTALCNTTDVIYCKYDGSLDEGIEIVTYPCTLDYHMYELRWKELCRVAKSYGFRSHDAGTCGLHIHVGRKQLGTNKTTRNVVAARIILLVDRHWESMVTFSRRTASQLDNWAARSHIGGTYSAEARAEVRALSGTSDTRYHAVNIENRETIEFRLFRGTLNRDTLVASLQLVNNICEFAKAHTTLEVLTSNWLDVINLTPFKELTAYCTDRSLMTEPNTAREYTICPAPTEVDGFKIGDRVVSSGCAYGTYRGQTGTIAAIPEQDDYPTPVVDILFDHPFEMGRTLDGIENSAERGYRNTTGDLAHLAPEDDPENIPVPELSVGDRVIIINPHIPRSSDLPMDLTGTLRVIRPNSDGLDYGVEFDRRALSSQHNLGDVLTNRRGYWTARYNIAPTTIPTPVLYDPQLGDRIIMTGAYNYAFHGDTGTIREIYPEGESSCPIGIEFDDYRESRHNLGGRCADGYGYWVPSLNAHPTLFRRLTPEEDPHTASAECSSAIPA